MTRRRAEWTNRLSTDERNRDRAERLRQASLEHDALEQACVDLAKVKYKLELYKADAKAVRVKNKRTGNFNYITRCTSGIPDRFAVIPPTGRYAGFEVKTGCATLRSNQQETTDGMIANGAAIYVIYSVAEFDTFLRLLLDIEREKAKMLETVRETA